ncbi:MAG: hypothetical protein JXR77_12060 [Lentisphaeria bacterium]|nr:hypothetical protein [Lentisphaeria bacterium]
MKPLSGRQLRQALRQVDRPPEVRDADTFWEEFQARVALTSQQAPGQCARVVTHSAWWHVAWACVPVVALALVLSGLRQPDLPALAAAPLPASTVLSEVEQVDVFSDYSSVMIVEDEANGGTLIWVASMDAGPMP